MLNHPAGINANGDVDYEEPSCPTCGGDGYTETWNDDQSGVVITVCPNCGPTSAKEETHGNS